MKGGVITTDKPLLTIKEVAEILCVSTRTIRRRISSGCFIEIVQEEGGRKILFKKKDLEDYIKNITY